VSTSARRPGRARAGDPPPVVLGLCSFTHDSAAALVVDDALGGMVEEERLSGVKHTKAYPASSIDWLLAEAGVQAGDVDIVAYNFAGIRYLTALPQSGRLMLDPAARSAAIPRARGFAAVHRNYRLRMRILRDRFPHAGIRPVLHHRAHGLYAFATSGYDNAAVLIIDSLGETQSTSIARARQHSRVEGGALDHRVLRAIHDPASLGYVYGAVTQHLGWRRGDEEGTVMALAAHGDPARFRNLFHQGVTITPEAFRLDPGLFPVRTLLSGAARVTPGFVAATCPPRAAHDEITQVHADLAAALQERTEDVVLHLARLTRQLTGSARLCIGGGVAMNCVSIGKIVQSGLFDEVFVPPAPGDSGTAIGAAIAASLDAGRCAPKDVAHRCYLGPAIAQPRESHQNPRATQDLFARFDRQVMLDPAQFLADRLAEGLIVGLAQGSLEAGPRALGNRSILASSLLPGVVDRLNATVKFRESFRPFAPVVLASMVGDYFRLSQPSPYMSIAAPVTELARREIPAVVHANGTARVQTVSATQNPFLAEVLERFAARTGVPVLINTSLNIKGKPICGTLEMALDCLRESGLDALMLDGGLWVTDAHAVASTESVAASSTERSVGGE
jgi:carbamoyltransferase